MISQLRRFYMAILSPVIVGFLLAVLLRYTAPGVGIADPIVSALAPLLLTSAVAVGAAGPIFYRSLFAFRLKGVRAVSPDALLKFERRLIGIALLAPYLALAAYVMHLPRFHLAGSLLASLYAAYYSYPFRKRIDLDRRIFRVDRGKTPPPQEPTHTRTNETPWPSH